MTDLQLTTLTDEDLHKLLANIRKELEDRDDKRKTEATLRIKALAEDAGLSVSVKTKEPKKRGRPRKQHQKITRPAKEAT